MKNVFRFSLMALSTAFLFVSCSNDDDNITNDDDLPLGDYENGVFVLNEGGFGASNASVSFIDADGNLYNNIYTNVNEMALGDTAQSIGFDDDKAYIVVNGSNTIEVVNRYTFEHITTITAQLANPRYIVFNNGKGYVSNWGDPLNPDDDYIAVINTSSYAVESTIPVAEGPEKMEKEGNSLYVAHRGGWGYGNSISVISLSSNNVTTTIEVADIPDSLEEENGILYVLCKGKESWAGEETQGALVKINTATNVVVESLSFGEGVHPSNLDIENGTIYYTVDADVYQKGLNAPLPSSPLFSVGSQGVYGIYGFAVEDDKIYVGDAKDYSSNGEVFIYSLTGQLQNNYTVGVTPNGFYFN